MKKFFTAIFLFCVFVSNLALAAIPSPESIIRNAQNATVNANIATLGLKITAEQAETTTTYFASITLLGEKRERYDLWQELYSEEKMSRSSLLTFLHKSNFLASLKKEYEMTPAQGFFYSLLFNFAFNKSDLYASTLVKLNRDFSYNSSLINQEKVALLAKYRNYLRDISKDAKLKKTLESPLSPAFAKDREQIQALYSSNLIKATDKAQLVRINKEFFWKITLSNTELFYTNESRQLRKISYTHDKHTLEILCSEYITFHGEYRLPAQLVIKVSDDNPHQQIFTINITSLEYSNMLPDQYVSKILSKEKGLRDSIAPNKQLAALPFLYLQ
ncbi:MAG: hypothetical protein HQK50_17190 [Oligoflexia bacterium]|nr:hypothetical protein [Oligoflexia bacterium]MBF0367314.1 hypothetical protein [Oligoflexia bacterium]